MISFVFDRPTMSWTKNKDIYLMREMAAQGIFNYRSCSRERGNVWQIIAQNLNCHRDLFEALTSRGARDRFTLISRRLKAKNAQEIKSTGGSGEQQTEYELLLEELIQLSDDSDKKAEAESEKVKENLLLEKQKAMDIRNKAMETMGETKKRSNGDDENKERKTRRSGSDTVAWLEKKAEREAKFKEMALQEQREDRELQRQERKEQMELNQKNFQLQIESQQQQQQQQQNLIMQQMVGMMQQQQQQMQVLMSKLQPSNKD